MADPEARAREEIDRQLALAGWVVQDRAKLNLSKLGALPVPVTPKAGQTRIVGEVERRLSVVVRIEATIETNLKRAAALRQAILRMTFEGRLVEPLTSSQNDEVLLGGGSDGS